MEILDALRDFDGKHTKPLEELAFRGEWDTQAIGTLLVCVESDESNVQSAATWVLKCLQERGVSFNASQHNQLLNLLHKVAPWEAKLHLLQMLPQLRVTSQQAEPLFQTIAGFLDSEDNKFVRAWSYNGLIVLATQHRKLRKKVASLIAEGQQEEAASVKARIRKALKDVNWME
ncbi:hypothetical protein [Bythopirellula goksoeyrii]|uniref:HEAT repeat protein n=1 Tax=Bythopirellula goksoeyrii TaxID=1400387 RepID=A0A5B9QV58_9BACT|nr:hypothetical protein [Bythopirellula goksoeyrii]QEG37813.1 hypothetical protein Pr1d_51600 [Bythopirellula goksoeyrii]